jgi:hypothetical protein
MLPADSFEEMNYEDEQGNPVAPPIQMIVKLLQWQEQD